MGQRAVSLELGRQQSALESGAESGAHVASFRAGRRCGHRGWCSPEYRCEWIEEDAAHVGEQRGLAVGARGEARLLGRVRACASLEGVRVAAA